MRVAGVVLITVLLAVLGCSDTLRHKSACTHYEAVYARYRATTKTGTVSDEEAVGAQAAALFLALNCRWTHTGNSDSNGVPVIVPH